MQRALRLAKLGQYHCSPNPCVGCVITDNHGQILGQGFHQTAGGPHAEINALIDAKNNGKNVQGATAYVTLEPCSHFGKTGPCANALIDAGIKRVVIASGDVNPEVSGRGIKFLQDAGIVVSQGLLEADALALNQSFNQRMQTGKPFVFSKIAASVDGRIAMQSGESKWLTGTEARADVQRLRAQSCAIITGISTVLADNPSLNVRDQRFALEGDIRQPLRLIIDSQLKTPLDAKILTTGPLAIAYCEGSVEKLAALKAKNVECVQLENGQGQVDLTKAVVFLANKGCHKIMLEAGGRLNGAFIEQNLINTLEIYMAPMLLGQNAMPMTGFIIEKMLDKKQLTFDKIRHIGNDLRLTCSIEGGG